MLVNISLVYFIITSIIHGASARSTRNTAIILGTKESVISWIWVTACMMLMTRPTAIPTISTGAETMRITSMVSLPMLVTNSGVIIPLTEALYERADEQVPAVDPQEELHVLLPRVLEHELAKGLYRAGEGRLLGDGPGHVGLQGRLVYLRYGRGHYEKSKEEREANYDLVRRGLLDSERLPQERKDNDEPGERGHHQQYGRGQRQHRKQKDDLYRGGDALRRVLAAYSEAHVRKAYCVGAVRRACRRHEHCRRI